MDQRKIGNFISSLRKEKDITQRELGEMIGVSNSTISRWEKGESYPDAGMYDPLSKALDITVAELLSGERIPDNEYKKTADEKIISLSQDKERLSISPYSQTASVLCVAIIFLILYTLIHKSGIDIVPSDQAVYFLSFISLVALEMMICGIGSSCIHAFRDVLSGKNNGHSLSDETASLNTLAYLSICTGIVLGILFLQSVLSIQSQENKISRAVMALSPIIYALITDIIISALKSRLTILTAYQAYASNTTDSRYKTPDTSLNKRKFLYVIIPSIILVFTYGCVLYTIQTSPGKKIFDDGNFIASSYNNSVNSEYGFHFRKYTNLRLSSDTIRKFDNREGHIYKQNGKKIDLRNTRAIQSNSVSYMQHQYGIDLSFLRESVFYDNSCIAVSTGVKDIDKIILTMTDCSVNGYTVSCKAYYPVHITSATQLEDKISFADSITIYSRKSITANNYYVITSTGSGAIRAYVNYNGVIYIFSSDSMPEKAFTSWIDSLYKESCK